MTIAKKPSKITLPANTKGWGCILAFLVERFAHISEAEWQDRMAQGKVHWTDGTAIDKDSPYIAGKVVCYYREVRQEPVIPFEHGIIFQNEHIIVADKPHFLQVTPGGQFVNECLLARLQRELMQDDIVPVHRLDRDTAGLVMFSINPDTRPSYFALFAEQRVQKTYQAVAQLSKDLTQKRLPVYWQVKNRIVPSKQSRICQQYIPETAEQINAKSDIALIEKSSKLGLFQLTPHTGKTHQLRLHMMHIGMPILNDRFYPTLKPREEAENYNEPLQLLAQSLRFNDPVSGEASNFQSKQALKYAPIK